MIQLTHPTYEPGGWHTTLIIFATMAFCSGVNLFAFRLVPWFELLAGILNVCLLFIFFVVLWVMSPRNSTDVFFESNVSSGWDNYFVAANLGALSNIFLFCCELSFSPWRSCLGASKAVANHPDGRSLRERYTYG